MKRRRRGKRAHEVTSTALTQSLSRVAWENYWGGAEEGRAAWFALKPQLPKINLGRRRAPFWAYEDVPEDLRGDGSVEAQLDRALELRRCRWLLGDGAAHLQPGEAASVTRHIPRLEQEIVARAAWEPPRSDMSR